MTFNTLELIKLSNKNKALAKLLKKRKRKKIKIKFFGFILQ